MNALLIPLSVICFALNSALTRTVQLRHPGDRSALTLYQACFCGAAALLFGGAYLVGGGGVDSIVALLLYGGAFGVFFFLAVCLSAVAYDSGPMSLASILLNLSLLVPMVYSMAVYGDGMSLPQGIGVALILVTLILVVSPQKGGRPTLRWWMVLLPAFFANGITAVLQKQYAASRGEGGSLLFLSVAYATAALLFAGRRIFVGGKSALSGKDHGVLLGLSLLSGAGSFGGNALLGYLCLRVSGAVLYPAVNGGLCILSALLSFLLFKEAVTRRKLMAIAVGLCAIVLLN